MRRTTAAQGAAAIGFGCPATAAAFLRSHGWEAVEETTPWDAELLYGVLTVGLDYPPALRAAAAAAHGGQEPLCALAVGRRGF